MAFPKPADLDEMKKDPQLTVLQKEGLNIGYIAFNTEKKPFDNKLVRQALNLATNKEAILKAVYLGNGQVGEESDPADPVELQQRGAGLPVRSGRRPKELLDAGRLSRTASRSSCGTCRSRGPYNPDGKRMAEMIQADWEKVGVKAKLIDLRVGRVSQAQRRPASIR